MTRPDIFSGDNPFEMTRVWMDEATGSEPNDPNAIQLATVDADGVPNVRTVLLKEIETNAFVFYTNYTSTKAQELEGAGQAAFVLFWKTLGRQVRARGPIERVSAAQSDAYYNSRDLGSRIGAWASDQSSPLDSRETLEARVSDFGNQFGETPKRPEHWGGYRLTPLSMEFWANGEHRLHDRFTWSRMDATAPWSVQRLYP
ncbi:MAG: pyridoxamine 5'-phosphate oxidase [Pseudomonadota bacterium]